MKIEPINFINTLRDSDSYIKTIYLYGGCYQFFKVLKTVFPNAVPYINQEKNHVVTMIDGNYYDITGITNGKYQPLTKDDISRCEKWSFSRNYWLNKECPNCDEPIPVTA